ncbi:MAG: hypothetical protein ACFIN3_01085 [Candidatus Walczuchella monophlebidarum]
MGLGPNSGLIMVTRSGDLDTTIIFYFLSKSYSPEYLYEILNKKSVALSGYSPIWKQPYLETALSGNSDMRDSILN